jgi:hypothetical protein
VEPLSVLEVAATGVVATAVAAGDGAITGVWPGSDPPTDDCCGSEGTEGCCAAAPPVTGALPLSVVDGAEIDGAGNAGPLDVDSVVASDELFGLLRTTREVESPGMIATARMPSDTSEPTWKVKLESPAPSAADSWCLQS